MIDYLILPFHDYSVQRNPHSFPTRRSSDLTSLRSIPFSASRRFHRSRSIRTYSSATSSAGGCARHQWRRSEEHTSELQSRGHIVCGLRLEKKKSRIKRK